jgi:GDP-L-fucose synthase
LPRETNCAKGKGSRRSITMNKDAKVYVAGHRGLVGSAIVRKLKQEGYANLLLATSKELNLREQSATRDFFEQERPDYVFLAAARVGGILANNSFPADFIYQNLMIEANVIESARLSGVNKLLCLGSTCIYPKMAPQPLKEEYLLTGPLEPTNEWYAVAKIAGIKLCQAYQRQYGCKFISAMPTNLYGPEDNFDLESSHVMPALIRKFHEAKVGSEPSVTVWGSGKPLREFLHVDDCATACMYLMENYDSEGIVNIGVGADISIAGLAELVGEAVGYKGEIVYDSSKPDGTPRKLVDTSRINGLGWEASIALDEGIRSTYQWFLDNEV